MTDPRLLRQETRELLAVLGKLNQEVPGVALGILDGSLSVEKQVEFGALLVAAGELVRTYGWSQGLVVESPNI